MKKLAYLISLLSLFLITCNKNDRTADGKPTSDAANNTVRVDTKAGANYQISIATYDSVGPSDPKILYSSTDQSNAASFEYSFKGTAGWVIAVEVYSQNGTFADCDIYYKGLKVPIKLEAIDTFQGEMPSHININYVTGATSLSP